MLTAIKLPLLAAVASAALSAWGTWAFLDARHESEIQSIRAAAAEQYAAATQRAVEVERAHAELATKLEVQHEKATRQLAAIRADNRRLAAAAGRLRDPFAAASTCPVSTDSDSAVDSAAAAATGRLSDETSEFLLGFAYDADRAEQRITELRALVERIDRRVESFDEYVASCVKKLPDQEIKGELVTVKIRKPSKKVEVFDEALLPVDFVKIPEPKAVIMKSEIAEALKSGVEVPGARLVDGKESLNYRVRTT